MQTSREDVRKDPEITAQLSKLDKLHEAFFSKLNRKYTKPLSSPKANELRDDKTPIDGDWPLESLYAKRYCEISQDYKNPFVKQLLDHRQDNTEHAKIRYVAIWRILNTQTKESDLLKLIMASIFTGTLVQHELIAKIDSAKELLSKLSGVSVQDALESIKSMRSSMNLDLSFPKADTQKKFSFS